MVEYSDNVGVAFGVVIAAGLSTAVGASVVFFPSLVQYANRKTLAGGLGLSAGVMTYVSFVEIYQKSVTAFVDADFLEHQAVFAASLCFFMGIIFMICLNLIIHGIASQNLLTAAANGQDDDEESDHDESISSSCDDSHFHDEEESHRRGSKKSKMDDRSRKSRSMDDSALIDTPSPCMCSDNPVERLEHMQEMAQRVHDREEDHAKEEDISEGVWSKTDVIDFSEEAAADMEQGNIKKISKEKLSKKSTASTTSSSSSKKKKQKPPSKKDKRKLTMMSMNTAVAIALHNFPEGLATFVATLQDPAVGAVLGVAIAIHNIPEGLCVAMPVYYATGNRWRAFMWGMLSGISEPLAAVFGWLVLSKFMNDLIYGVLFGVVAGMMVLISVKELLPTAHRYDPEDSVVTNMFIVGMAVMGASVVLFAQIA